MNFSPVKDNNSINAIVVIPQQLTSLVHNELYCCVWCAPHQIQPKSSVEPSYAAFIVIELLHSAQVPFGRKHRLLSNGAAHMRSLQSFPNAVIRKRHRIRNCSRAKPCARTLHVLLHRPLILFTRQFYAVNARVEHHEFDPIIYRGYASLQNQNQMFLADCTFRKETKIPPMAVGTIAVHGPRSTPFFWLSAYHTCMAPHCL